MKFTILATLLLTATEAARVSGVAKARLNAQLKSKAKATIPGPGPKFYYGSEED